MSRTAADSEAAAWIIPGILLDARDHNVARQHPGDYLVGLEKSVRATKRLPLKIIFKPILTRPEEIRALCLEAKDARIERLTG
jgi:hypothetical protein